MISTSEQIQERSRTKVLFVIESFAGGGAEKVLATLVRLIDKERFYVSVCTVVDTGVYADEVKKHVDAYTSILGDPARMGFVRKLWYKIMYKLVYHVLPMRWIYTLFVPHHADVEVAFIEGFVTRLIADSSNAHAKKLAWIHVDLGHTRWTTSVYRGHEHEVRCYQHFNTVIGVSDEVTCVAMRLFHPRHAITLYNPIDRREIWDKSSVDFELPTPSGFRIVSLGRYVEQKSYMRLLRVVNYLHKENYPVELWLLGEGEDRANYEKYISENELDNVVTLWGFQRNPYPYIKASTLYVCSSEYEGYSTAVHESLIVGSPVVSTDVSGADELLHHGACGLITANDEDALYEGIKSLLDHPEKLDEYKSNISRHYGLEVPNDQMKRIESVLISK